ncbi:MAG: DUF2141 domain-containing protein, partial [Bacteroidia bacterium]|nr:DUF2141 domain-containing protein [Bacteroidia bacterium]MDW8333531.1 DUF2141 domain-containing protein [Bacteroidia bacterium]
MAKIAIAGLCITSAAAADPIREDNQFGKTSSRRQNSGGFIEVIVRGLRNSVGRVTCYLFRGKEGFPEEKEKTIAVQSVPISGNRARMVFPNLPPGEYALAALHDENENRKMDYNFIGIPKEGWAFSNIPSGMLRKPDFSECAF